MKLSLRADVLLVTCSMLIVALSSYLLLAINMFNDDKTTYIYEGNATLVSTLSAELIANLKSSQKTLDLVTSSVVNSKANIAIYEPVVQRLFEGEDELVYLRLQHSVSGAPVKQSEFVNRDFFKPYSFASNKLSGILSANAAVAFSPRGIALRSVEAAPNLHLLAFSARSSAGLKLEGFMRQDRRMKLLSRSESFLTYLSDKYGNIITHPNMQSLKTNKTLSGTPMFDYIIKNKFETGVREMKVGKEEAIIAYSKIPDYDLVVISQITTKKAFLASQKLIEKSVLFAVLILMLAFMVSVIFAKQITRSLSKLYSATQEIMRGNFAIAVNISSQDEVGALSQSFNKMASEVKRLLVETADKARMEKELETAQLVQDNFIPANELTVGEYKIVSFYKSASECGGDWWSFIPAGDNLILLIGDATGHGVPSALITAAAQSCCSTLESMSSDYPEIEFSPAWILKKLNNAIFRASRGAVKMTFFCGVLNTKTNTFKFANASHEAPILCKPDTAGPNAPRQKTSIANCTTQPGLILGQETVGDFPESQIEIEPGTVLFMYTDGLVENKNKANQMLGKGRVIRNLYKSAHLGIDVIKKTILDDAISFYGDRDRDDDITTVILKRA